MCYEYQHQTLHNVLIININNNDDDYDDDDDDDNNDNDNDNKNNNYDNDNDNDLIITLMIIQYPKYSVWPLGNSWMLCVSVRFLIWVPLHNSYDQTQVLNNRFWLILN